MKLSFNSSFFVVDNMSEMREMEKEILVHEELENICRAEEGEQALEIIYNRVSDDDKILNNYIFKTEVTTDDKKNSVAAMEAELAKVKRVIECCKGKISVSNVLKEGTNIKLPHYSLK